MSDWNQLSILEVAEELLQKNKQPMSFIELFQAICEVKELTDEEKNDIIAQVYADFIISAKFVYVGDDQWDLKSRQSIDLWDKDGAYYDELPDYQEELEELEEEEEYEEDEEEREDEIDEEEGEEEDEYETEPDFEDYEDDIDYDDFEDEEDEFVEDESDITPEEEEDFDDEKYNEYMDDYEKMYDE